MSANPVIDSIAHSIPDRQERIHLKQLRYPTSSPGGSSGVPTPSSIASSHRSVSPIVDQLEFTFDESFEFKLSDDESEDEALPRPGNHGDATTVIEEQNTLAPQLSEPATCELLYPAARVSRACSRLPPSPPPKPTNRMSCKERIRHRSPTPAPFSRTSSRMVTQNFATQPKSAEKSSQTDELTTEEILDFERDVTIERAKCMNRMRYLKSAGLELPIRPKPTGTEQSTDDKSGSSGPVVNEVERTMIDHEKRLEQVNKNCEDVARRMKELARENDLLTVKLKTEAKRSKKLKEKLKVKCQKLERQKQHHLKHCKHSCNCSYHSSLQNTNIQHLKSDEKPFHLISSDGHEFAPVDWDITYQSSTINLMLKRLNMAMCDTQLVRLYLPNVTGDTLGRVLDWFKLRQHVARLNENRRLELEASGVYLDDFDSGQENDQAAVEQMMLHPDSDMSNDYIRDLNEGELIDFVAAADYLNLADLREFCLEFRQANTASWSTKTFSAKSEIDETSPEIQPIPRTRAPRYESGLNDSALGDTQFQVTKQAVLESGLDVMPARQCNSV